jgi:phosphate transport system permease protein
MANGGTQPDPKRFEVSKATLWFDHFMGWLIRFGGIGVIIAVFGILFFIGREVIPLFRQGKVHPEASLAAKVAPKVIGIDEWGQLPFFYSGGNTVRFVSLDGSTSDLTIEGYEGLGITSASYDAVHGRVAVGLADGRVGSFLVTYQRTFEDGKEAGVVPSITPEPWFELNIGSGPVTEVSYSDSGNGRIVAAKRGTGQDASLVARIVTIKKGLIGKPKLTAGVPMDLSAQVGAEPMLIKASPNGTMLVVSCADGDVHYFAIASDDLEKVQDFRPFPGGAPTQMDFLFGGVSMVLTGPGGNQQEWSLYRESEDADRRFGKTGEMASVGDGEVLFSASQRNRSYLTGSGRHLVIRHSTSGTTRWEGDVDIEASHAALDAKGESFIVANEAGESRRFSVHDRHPEAGWRPFFGKVWYEGGASPVYQWQSTGGSDDFEPKLSLMPLIFGSLKGTLFSLLFAVPVALLAAVFSAAFLPHEVKKIVKPAMEIMSSLPSVVLGFLAGLWLAPLLENRVPSVMMICWMVPLVALLAGYGWCRLPLAVRNRLSVGAEWMLVAPVLLLTGWIAWNLGPLVESFLFVYKEPGSGKAIADFRLWWPQVTGLSFEQRNSMVLGFMMGFAVIPVIFTIAEDALSNVPKPLTAAAAALGANRWQVVRTVMIPVASSGIFSALMIGFGRAVGETMVMVMATGNTPVMQWNLFNGMRTLSANIAVELPEAPVGSTHYRVLFLGAVVLFLMTFVLNTAAEVLRQHLREKNKIV